MTYISTVSNIRLDGHDIEYAILDGVVVYEKANAEDFYIEYKLDNSSDYFYRSIPNFYIGSIKYDGLNNNFYEKIEITLEDGTVIDNLGPKYYECREIANVKLWYPKSVTSIDFDYKEGYGDTKAKIKSFAHCDTRFFKHMDDMFYECDEMTSLNASGFNTRRVINMSQMFMYCKSLYSLDLNNFNTSNVVDMNRMFMYCENLESLNVSSFNTGNVVDMEYIFASCKNLEELNVSSFNTSNVTNMKGMFECCENLKELNVNHFDTSKVEWMEWLFFGCKSLTKLDISDWNFSRSYGVEYMFQECVNLEELDLRKWDTSVIGRYAGADRPNNFDYMLRNCNKLHTLRLDNCNNTTINDIITSEGFPTGNAANSDGIAITDSEGNPIPRKIYCRQANAAGLTAPNGWSFEFID